MFPSLSIPLPFSALLIISYRRKCIEASLTIEHRYDVPVYYIVTLQFLWNSNSFKTTVILLTNFFFVCVYKRDIHVVITRLRLTLALRT